MKMIGHSLLCRKIITVYSENNMKHLGTLRQIAEFFSLRALWCMEIMTVFWHYYQRFVIIVHSGHFLLKITHEDTWDNLSKVC